MHSLATEKGKRGHLSMHLKGLKQQTHTAMNAKVLNDQIAIMQRNEQKATAHTKIPNTVEWDQLSKIAKDLKEVQKPPSVKVAQDHLLQIFGIPTWRYGTIPQDAFSHLEKDEDLEDAITSSKTTSTRKAMVAWDATLLHGFTKDEFVVDAIRVVLMHCHLFTDQHVAKAKETPQKYHHDRGINDDDA
ncbi:unnamed protein product [Sphagnum balticum]